LDQQSTLTLAPLPTKQSSRIAVKEDFGQHTDVPRNKKSSYLRIVSAWRPEKENPCRVHFTVGGDHLKYLSDASTKSAELATVKLLLNHTVSTPGPKFMMIRP
jgi:hypothetical protein